MYRRHMRKLDRKGICLRLDLIRTGISWDQLSCDAGASMKSMNTKLTGHTKSMLVNMNLQWLKFGYEPGYV